MEYPYIIEEALPNYDKNSTWNLLHAYIDAQDKNKCRSITRFDEPIKKCAKLTAKLLTAAYKSKVVKLKLYEDPVKRRVYFLSFMNSLKIVLSNVSEIRMLIMECPSIRGEELPNYSKNSTWNLLHAYIYVHSQRLIDECTGDGVQSISILQS